MFCDAYLLFKAGNSTFREVVASKPSNDVERNFPFRPYTFNPTPYPCHLGRCVDLMISYQSIMGSDAYLPFPFRAEIPKSRCRVEIAIDVKRVFQFPRFYSITTTPVVGDLGF
jgi:hypothetical protein